MLSKFVTNTKLSITLKNQGMKLYQTEIKKAKKRFKCEFEKWY